MLREIGTRIVGAEAITDRDDIFWLTEDEVAEAAARLDGGETLEGLSHLRPGTQEPFGALPRRLLPP